MAVQIAPEVVQIAPETEAERLRMLLEELCSRLTECRSLVEVAVAAGVVLNELRGLVA